jgi:2'-5' RNA ligase
VRAFFAVEIGNEARREAGDHARRLAGGAGGDAVHWVRSEAYHVTLRFLGAVAVDRIPELVDRVRDATAGIGPFELRLGALRAFPSERRPRVVAIELEPAEPLAALAVAVERGSVAAGFAPEKRSYRPHLTLGRVRGPHPPRLEGCVAPAPFPVRSFTLFRSELSPRGSTYTPLERIPLDGASP